MDGVRALTGVMVKKTTTPPRLPFDSVVREHGTVVLRVCRAVLGVQDAEDAWSQTFLSALRAYPALPADADVRAWLVTIAHRASIDVLRATARRAESDRPPPEGAVPGADAGDDARQLWAEVAALPDKQRRAVAYRYFAGLDHRSIAALLGGTEAAARRACSDGLAALRRRLAADDAPADPARPLAPTTA